MRGGKKNVFDKNKDTLRKCLTSTPFKPSRNETKYTSICFSIGNRSKCPPAAQATSTITCFVCLFVYFSKKLPTLIFKIYEKLKKVGLNPSKLEGKQLTKKASIFPQNINMDHNIGGNCILYFALHNLWQ